MKRVLLFFVFFLCTIQRREISLNYARASPLAAKFCTKTKTKKTPRPLAVLLLTLDGGRGKGGGGVVNNCLLCNYIKYSKS
jgi:hypothetical protein